jgi:hypothetical protein
VLVGPTFAQASSTVITACTHPGGPLFIGAGQCSQPNETLWQCPTETAFQNLQAQVTASRVTTYTAPGTYTYMVPAGVTALQIAAWGGGGGGGGSAGALAGGGGGSGAYVKAVVSVTPGDTLTVVVAAGGVGGLGTSTVSRVQNGMPGGASWVADNGTVLVRANGGAGGGNGLSGNGGAAGTFQVPGVALAAAMTPGTAAQNASADCSAGTVGTSGSGGGVAGTAGAGGNGGGGTCSIPGPFANGAPGEPGAIVLTPVTSGS